MIRMLLADQVSDRLTRTFEEFYHQAAAICQTPAASASLLIWKQFWYRRFCCSS